MDFWKMNGNGNDFVVITNRGLSLPDMSGLAKRVCRRRASIGADGLIALEPSDSGFFMHIFNSDGSRAGMCGNGARCAARYAFLNGLADSPMTFKTLAGPIRAKVAGSFVEIGMGKAEDFSAKPIEFFLKGWRGDRVGDFVTVGVPHFVLYPDKSKELTRDQMIEFGRELRYDESLFPEGVNVNFCVILDEHTLSVTTYERGVEDLTDSCGTGSTAAALCASRRFSGAFPITVRNPGGINRVSLDEGSVVLGGNTAVVAKGTIEEEA